jgi:hypothetical protein
MSFTNEREDIILTDQLTDISKTPERQSDQTADDFWGTPISVYTRQQAIEDGVLVDVSAWASSGPEGMLGGFVVPVAITQALWAVIDIDHNDNAERSRCQSLARQRGESTRGRAHDVLWLLSVAAAGVRRPTDRLLYSVLMTGEGKSGRLVRRQLTLEARIDSDGITVGFPEDF